MRHALYLQQGKEKPFYDILKGYLQTQINLADKRHIHIVLACLAQASGPPRIVAQIKKAVLLLQSDDYGKYLLCFYNQQTKPNGNSVYARISNEHERKRVKPGVNRV